MWLSLSGPSVLAVSAQATKSHRHWRRVGVPAVPEWETQLPAGDLQETGAVITAIRHAYPEQCSVCGRTGRLWHAGLELPAPVADFVPLAPGCTREHAVTAAPASWAQVAETFAAYAKNLRGRAFREHIAAKTAARRLPLNSARS